WGVYLRDGDRFEVEGVFPEGFEWSDAALGPDNNIYLTQKNEQRFNPDIAYVVADAAGKILMTRGADFDRLCVTLPDSVAAAGTQIAVEAHTVRSRDLGFVPKANILPSDNRPALALKAWLAPIGSDPLAEPALTEVPIAGAGENKFNIAIPAVAGPHRLEIAATPRIPGFQPLGVSTELMILPAGSIAHLVPKTDRNRTGFAAGSAIRVTVPAKPKADVDLAAAQLALLDPADPAKPLWTAPLGLRALKADEAATAVVNIPEDVTLRLRPGTYSIALANLPAGVSSGSATAQIIPVNPLSIFQTPMHPIGTSYRDSVRDAKLHAEFGATHIVSPGVWDATYLDILSRLGVGFHYQPYTHYSPINVLPEEHGAMRQQIALLAQKMQPYPAFRGFTYHDLQVQPYGGLGDAARKDFYEPLWSAWAKDVKVPATVPAEARELYGKNVAKESMLDRMYKELGEAIGRVNPNLHRSSMQWWHQSLAVADPDRVSKHQNLISTQHMEEQYYHPVTVANQADLWRRPGVPIWVYGNTSWQEDGTGASMYTDFMAALSRGVQGVGRNELPTFGDVRSELVHRTATAGFKLMQAYGGLSAIAERDDQVAVWRSFYQSCAESGNAHITATTAAYTACLYAHRTAAIISDDLVRAGDLMKYKAVIISFEIALPPDLAAKLQEFQAAGGLVLANNPGGKYWRPDGAIELGPVFNESHALAENNRDSLRHIGIEEDGINGARVLRQALGDKVKPIVECDDPTTWISVLKSGGARYIFTVNVRRLPQPPMDLHRYSGYENTRMPVKSELQLGRGYFIVYDVFSGQMVKPEERAGQRLVTADMSIYPGAIIALLPAPIEGLRLSAGQSEDRSKLGLRVEVGNANAPGKTVDAAVPLEIKIADAKGGTRFHLYRTAKGGVWQASALPVAANDAAGQWTISVTELLSGKQSIATLDVQPPALPAAAATPPVEWTGAERIAAALGSAKRIAVVVDEKQLAPLGPAVDAVMQFLKGKGKQAERISAKDYLADRTALQWDKFRFGPLVSPDIKTRPQKYDLIVSFDTPELTGGVIPLDALAIQPTAHDPGRGRGLVQYAVTPVYDTEDAISLAGGDFTGLVLAAKALANPPKSAAAVRVRAVHKPLEGRQDETTAVGISQFVGVPISELAASPDAKRIAVAFKGWGDNLIFVDDSGKVISKDIAGKFFPLQLQSFNGGFTMLQHDNDPTTMYLRMYDNEGKCGIRLAAFGRRIGGMRDWSASHPEVIPQTFLKQASFSLSADGQVAAVAGGNGIAVWNMKESKVIWRDDRVRYTAPGPQNSAAANAESFPQVCLTHDARLLAVQHNGVIIFRDAANGNETGRISLPVGASMGRIQFYNGSSLIVGDSEFFAFKDGAQQWYWKAPRPVTASRFANNAVHYAIGEVDGTLRIMAGGGQAAGHMVPSGAVVGLDIAHDNSRVAFASTTGWVGVMELGGKLIWQENVGSRATIRFLGNTPEVVVGDWKGGLRRIAADGKLLWQVNLTPEVWREGTVNWLTSRDQTPTLRVPPQDRPNVMVPPGTPNLAPQAAVAFLEPKNWWGQAVKPERPVVLNDGKTDPPEGGWFDRTSLEYVAFVPSPPAWEFTWKQPVEFNTLVAWESPNHAHAVPEEIRIEVWVDNDWKEIHRDCWTTGAKHAHRFDRVSTTKLRYMAVGDLANNLYLSEIEIYNLP
ncbi:MAG TPA: hypothetical protein VM141_05035, partial [Planctomycetota bacterium]|nr:hypothetical protein [Planctomycetota bacterium]